MASDLESRYGHLLQPIRDLAQNWHIDLASELEDYLHELERLTVSVDPATHSRLASAAPQYSAGGQAAGAGAGAGVLQLNFVEAALLIQGSACVYSKKVEYLYSLLYSTLEVVIEQRRKDAKKQSSINDSTGHDHDATADDDDDRPLLPLDSIQEANNIDLDERSAEPYAKARRATLLYRLPAALRQRAGREGGERQEGGGGFRISDCVVHSSGALLMEERDNALLDANLRRISADVPFGSPAAAIRAHRESLRAQPTSSQAAQHESASEAAAAVSQELDFNDHDGFDDNDDDAGAAAFDDSRPLPQQFPQPTDDATDSTAATGKAGKAVRFASDGHLCSYNELTVPIIDPYALLDPFDTSYPTKPFKRGKTIRTYKQPNTASHALYGSPTGASPLLASLEAALGKDSVRLPCHGEFVELFVACVARRRGAERLRRKRDREERERTDREADGLQHGAAQQLGAVDDAVDDESAADLFDDGEADGWDEPEPLPNADFLPPALSFLAATSSTNTSTSSSDHFSAASQTYEDLCRQHLDAYLASAEQSLASTALQARVRHWQDRLEPILEEEDSHPSFDIRLYGDRMLESLEGAAALRGSDGAGELVAFEQAVQGVEKWEVCRLFLATLQLANNGNVEIDASVHNAGRAGSGQQQAGDAADACAAMSSLTVRMVSRQQQTAKDRLDVGWLGSDDVVVAAQQADRAEEEDGEAEEEVEEVELPRKRKVRKAVAGKALQPVDGNTRAGQRKTAKQAADDTVKPLARARRARA